MKNLAVVILAAGEGTRMKSPLPKVMHKLSGKPLVRWVLDAAENLNPEKLCVVVGYGADVIKEELKKEKTLFAVQEKRLGSGHALAQAAKYLKGFKGNVLVLCGDVPLVRTQTLKALLELHEKNGNSATVLSSIVDNPFSYGRIFRSTDGLVKSIVEEKDASDEIRKIKEINSGIYVFTSPLIWDVLKKIKPENIKNEYYLTDSIILLNEMDKKVDAFPSAGIEEILGVNSRVELAQAESFAREKRLRDLMVSGVTIADPKTTFVSVESKIGHDTEILPFTIIDGKSVIGNNCKIGPSSYIKDSSIGDDSSVLSSHVYESKISNGVKIGPFSHVRPGSVIKDRARVGNFSEVKKSIIGEGSKVNHLSYIGDTEMGSDVNIGAGTITCNYDGKNKYKTKIGDGAFIGSNTNLVAPVKVGAGVLVGAGSTITEDVPAKMLALARARQVNLKRQ